MKILMIAGASRSVVWFRRELIRFLQDKGHSVSVVTCDRDNEEEIKSYGVDFYCIDGDNRDIGITSNLKYINAIKKLVLQIKPDKIMTFQAKANTFGVIGAKKARCKDITAMVEGLGTVFNAKDGFKLKFLRVVLTILYKYAFRKIPTTIFLNEQNKQFMIKKKIVKENQILLINGIGVDLERFKNSEEELPTDTIKFLMVARVEKQKGIVEYCEAAKRIIESGVKNVEFNCVGVCDLKKNILDDYQDYVFYYGVSRDMPSVYNQNHIVVLPSYHEGVPRSLMEACSAGKPLIATRIAGCMIVVQDNVNGKIVEVKDIDSLEQAMRYFIDNPEQINIMGKASRKIAKEKFDSNLINNQIWERVNG